MSPQRKSMRRRPILRRSADEMEADVSTTSQLPCLSDDVIEEIISKLSPTELVAYGWSSVNKGFGDLVELRLRKETTFCVYEDVMWKFFNTGCPILAHSLHARLLRVLIQQYFCHVKDFVVPVTILNAIQSELEQMCSQQPNAPCCDVALRGLERITVQIGEEWGPLSLSQNFTNLKVCKSLCHKLKEVNLDVKVTDKEDVTCCGLRALVRYLVEVTDENTCWNLTLEDLTILGQGWFGPTDLSKYRNKAFVCYVRALLDLGVNINRLTLLDKRKCSPYMLVMAGSKRRSIYMYPEYKRCTELFVCYDIGLIAPSFSHTNDRFEQLALVEVEQSHVLYKADLLEYLRNAINLKELRVVVPTTWSRRVSNCTRGCFSNPDFACFRADGWCAVHSKLPRTKFELIGCQPIPNRSQSEGTALSNGVLSSNSICI